MPKRPAISAVPYLPGLDGLRALAVLAVIAYHASPGRLPGGFLGVEVFFVVSGYLITLLLLAEHERTGRIGLKAFWARRARRLLPALYTLMVAVAVATATVPYLRSELAKLRHQLWWAFVYSTNWFQIVDHQSYFEAQGRPPLLRHLWSLAVEEQFYLVWPLVIVLVLKLFRRRLPAIGMSFLALSVLANVWMAVLYDSADPNRVYLGTDTRSGGLLLGAGVAMLWRPHAVMRGPLRRRGALIDLVGVLGMVVLGLTFLIFHDVVYTADGVRGYDLLYRGGFFLVGLATVAVIVAATHLRSTFGQRVLGAKPLAWVGTRSYGLYLWHWPVLQLTRPGGPANGGDIAWPGWAVDLLRVALTLVLTEVSYRLVEVPIRTRRFRGWIRMVIRSLGPRSVDRRRRFAVALAGALAIGAFTGVSVATAKDRPSDIESSLVAGSESVTGVSELIEASGEPTATPTTLESVATTGPESTPDEPQTSDQAAASSSAGDAPDQPADSAPPTDAVQPTDAQPTDTSTIPAFHLEPFERFALGDSVMLGAAPNLEAQGFVVDAKVSRQAKEGLDIIQTLADNSLLGDIVVVHLGTNGPTTRERFDQILQLCANVRLVILVTVKAPKPWAGEVNSAILDVADEYPNVRLLDWNSLSQSSLAPSDVFYEDGIHLRPSGRAFYTQLILDTIQNG